MKYNEKNQPLICMQTNSKCYKNTYQMKIKGILWHSTGCNNPYISRYVQPLEGAKDYSSMIALLGKNKNNNDYNHSAYDSGLNAFIGKLSNGSISTIQTMPWNYRPWGCGKGPKGTCNDGWIQFEICEDNLTDKNYFNLVYKEACELTAFLCKKFNLNPKGTITHNGVTVPTILCHADSHKLGLGSGHADVLHWFPKFGKTMTDVRNDVYNLMQEEIKPQIQKEEEEVTQAQFNEMFKEMRKTYQDNDSGSWSAEARKWAVDNGLITGNGTINNEPNYMWADFLTREQMATLLFRFAKLMGK